MVLVLQSIDGDIYETLIENVKPVIYKAISTRYISGYDHDDLFQEACMVLMRAIETYCFETDTRFIPYFSRCLNNHFNSLGRKTLTNKRRSLDSAVSMDYISEAFGKEFSRASFANSYSNPADQAIALETYKEYVSKLSKFENEVFRLYLLNHSFKEMATILGQDVPKIKSAVYRCSNKLRKSLADFA